jgi:hypothetical protein
VFFAFFAALREIFFPFLEAFDSLVTKMVIPEWFYRGSGLTVISNTIFPITSSGMTTWEKGH